MKNRVTLAIVAGALLIVTAVYLDKQEVSNTLSAKPISKIETDRVEQQQPFSLGEEVRISLQIPKETLQKVALVSGWFEVHDWGVWSNGKKAVLKINASNLPEKFRMELHYTPFIQGKILKQSYEFFNIHGKLLGTASVNEKEYLENRARVVTFDIDKTRDQGSELGYVSIIILIPDAASYKDAGTSIDEKNLYGFALGSLKTLPVIPVENNKNVAKNNVLTKKSDKKADQNQELKQATESSEIVS